MKIRLALCTLVLAVGAAPLASAHGQCDQKMLKGRWVFATSIGRQMLGAPFPPGKDITAIGTMNIEKDGALSGVFDATVQDTFFLPDNEYNGSVVVNADCTGTLTFVTSQGTARTDSIVIVSRNEFLGMSQDELNLWTYEARRISGKSRKRRDDD